MKRDDASQDWYRTSHDCPFYYWFSLSAHFTVSVCVKAVLRILSQGFNSISWYLWKSWHKVAHLSNYLFIYLKYYSIPFFERNFTMHYKLKRNFLVHCTKRNWEFSSLKNCCICLLDVALSRLLISNFRNAEINWMHTHSFFFNYF